MSTFTDNLKKLHEAARKGDRVDSGVPLREWVEASNTLDRTLRNAVPAIIEALEAAEGHDCACEPGYDPCGGRVACEIVHAFIALDALVKPE